MRWLVPLALFATVAAAHAETVNVRYRGRVDLAPFECEAFTRSSLVRRVCFDAANSCMLINLEGTWYHYCGINAATVSALKSAGSMGRYYNANIKGRFDCRVTTPPSYRK
jgi:hypothetical protein